MINRRTFLGFLGALPFSGIGFCKATDKKIIPHPMPGYVSEFYSMPALFEHALLHTKEKFLQRPERVYISRSICMALLQECVLKVDIQASREGIQRYFYGNILVICMSDDVVELCQGVNLSVIVADGSTHYSIWFKKKGYVLEYKHTYLLGMDDEQIRPK